jgi:hypothetical protein
MSRFITTELEAEELYAQRLRWSVSVGENDTYRPGRRCTLVATTPYPGGILCFFEAEKGPDDA